MLTTFIIRQQIHMSVWCTNPRMIVASWGKNYNTIHLYLIFLTIKQKICKISYE